MAVLYDGYRSSGFYSVDFDASGFASGIYVYRLSTHNEVLTRKMTVVK